MLWRKCLIVACAFAILCMTIPAFGDWAVTRPTANQEWKENKTVNTKGTGVEGTPQSLYVQIIQDDEEANAGTG